MAIPGASIITDRSPWVILLIGLVVGYFVLTKVL
jgi:hypothetical protein